MNYLQFIYISFIVLIAKICAEKSSVDDCSDIEKISLKDLKDISKIMMPPLTGKGKGEAGKIGVIGGSVEYTGAPYFSAISALRVGADVVYVITTDSAAPVIKSYSPDLIVYPFLNTNTASKLNYIISKMDVIVIGPGLGREDDIIKLTHDIIQSCKSLNKPLVIDADGLYAVWKNISILKDYPSPGAILTPNKREAMRLMEAVATKYTTAWYEYWGPHVSVLSKGEEDQFLTGKAAFKWSSSEGGSGRRAGGQGDLLSGSLGTFFNWALKYVQKPSSCDSVVLMQYAQSLASYSAAKLTRACNSRAFKENGRGMVTSDMLKEIPKAFRDEFS